MGFGSGLGLHSELGSGCVGLGPGQSLKVGLRVWAGSRVCSELGLLGLGFGSGPGLYLDSGLGGPWARSNS